MVPDAMIDLLAARTRLCGFETPLGTEVLVWLLKSPQQPKPLKDLYRSSRFSQRTIRTFLAHQADRGFVAVHSSEDNKRQRFAQPTAKLMAAVQDYRSFIVKAIETAAEVPPEPILATAG